jgi:hypothetical protein
MQRESRFDGIGNNAVVRLVRRQLAAATKQLLPKSGQ